MDPRPPQPEIRKMNYQEALAYAKADEAQWMKVLIWTLENHLVTTASAKFGSGSSEMNVFEQKLRSLKEKPTLNDLSKLGRQYSLIADYDLETESLKVFCRKNNIELIPE